MSFFLTFLATLALVATTNYAIDANEIYRAHDAQVPLVRSFVQRLLASETGLAFVPQERSVKLELARQSAADCVVLGSSHEIQLGFGSAPSIFDTCTAVVNLAVSGGSFEDFVAAIGIVIRRKFARTVYIGVGPWMLRRGADERFAEERAVYNEGRIVLGLEAESGRLNDDIAWYVNLISADYLQHNVGFLWRTMKSLGSLPVRRFEIKDGQLARSDEGVISSDGTIRYSRDELNKSPQPPGRGDYKIASPVLDPAVIAEFEQGLRLLVEQGVVIKMLLMPYHPAVLNCADARVCESLRQVEEYIRNLSQRCDFDVIGSYDPRPFALTGRDFMDEMHLNREALRILRPLTYNPWTGRHG